MAHSTKPPKLDFVQSVLQWIEFFQHDDVLKTDLGRSLAGFFYALAVMADKKQQDYGSENLTDFGTRGIVIRMVDKINRLRNLYFERKKPSTDPLLDTWIDWIVYEAIGFLMEAKIWPKGRAELPPRQVFTPGTLGDVLTKDISDLTEQSLRHQTREVAQRMQRQYHDESALPIPGKRYRSHRVPTTVECVTVIPSYSVTETVNIFVIYKHIHEPATEIEPHYICEPLDWFRKTYPLDEENNPCHPRSL